MSKQKRIRIYSDGLIFALRLERRISCPSLVGPRIRFLKLQQISRFENARDRVQHARPRQWRSWSQSRIRIG